MNLRQSYEQLIADKLRKLPVPDADASWQQMKRLLDNDEYTRAGGGKRPPGNGWWRIGIIAIVFLTSLWWYVEKTISPAPLAKNNTTAPSAAGQLSAEKGNSSSKKINIPVNNQKATIGKNITLPVTNAATASKDNDKTRDAMIAASNMAGTKRNTAVNNTSALPAAGNTVENTSLKASAAGNIPAHTGNDNHRNAIAGSIKDAKRNGLLSTHLVAGKENDENDAVNSFTAGPGLSGNKKNTAGLRTGNGSAWHAGEIKYLPGKASTNHLQHEGNFITSHYPPVNQPAGAEERSWQEIADAVTAPFNIPSFNTSLAIGDSIQSNRNTSNLLSNETKKLVVKAQRDKALEDMTRKEKKSFHLDLSNVFKPFSLHMDAEPRWAAGIALNSSIPLNAQNRYNYNMNGKSGTLTDYIPSVYLQFHLNDYVYAQTEINFISPQYTPQLLVYQQSQSQAQAGTSLQKSIYLQKLYYFNLPLSLHYSPINNLYFSAGLQFSSFQSGLVSIQEKQYTTQSGIDHPSSTSNSIVKFKDDSIAAKLSPNEWRWQAGAEYYWNRFTIGLHYNRAFRDLLNVNLSPSLPQTPLRNESLLFSVRYNLFESRKKGSQDQKN